MYNILVNVLHASIYDSQPSYRRYWLTHYLEQAHLVFMSAHVVKKAKYYGLNIMIGGDMNAHIWELDKRENQEW